MLRVVIHGGTPYEIFAKLKDRYPGNTIAKLVSLSTSIALVRVSKGYTMASGITKLEVLFIPLVFMTLSMEEVLIVALRLVTLSK